MIKSDKQLGTPFVNFTDTKSNIEALSSTREGAVSYAIDVDQFGIFNGSVWIWYRSLNDSIVALIDQNANIPTTNFPNANTAGTYRVSYYLEVTSSDIAAGTIVLTIAWTDDAGATSFSTSSLALTSTGRLASPSPIFIRMASGNVTYSVTVTGIFGTAVYRLYAVCERMS